MHQWFVKVTHEIQWHVFVNSQCTWTSGFQQPMIISQSYQALFCRLVITVHMHKYTNKSVETDFYR